MEFIHSNILKDHTWATEVKVIDLPINPISFLSLTLSGFNATDESTLAEILGFLNGVQVTYRGMTVMDLESEDLFALNLFLLGRAPFLDTSVATDDMPRNLTLLIPFGRKMYNGLECFKATKKGELQLRLDCTVPATSFDNGVINVHCVELPGASPSQYLKSTLLKVVAPGATGDNDVSLPIGNKITGVMLWETTGPTAAQHTQGIENVRILVNNSEYGFVSGRFISEQALCMNKIQTLARVPAAAGLNIVQKYAYLDFDPDGSENFLLDTSGKSSVVVRLNMGVDEASKVMPLEIVSI